MSTLYEHSNYTDKTLDCIVNQEIIEYDMRNAGFNLSKEFKLLGENKIKLLSELTKVERTIRIGKYQMHDKEYRQRLSQAFVDARKMFFESNGLDESNVLSIKKDAIFTFKRCEHTTFGQHIEFVEKNKYTSYYKFGEYEFYFSEGNIDIKGINDKKLEKHSEHFLTALHELMFKMERQRSKSVIMFLKDFIYLYKTKQLPIEYYRELNDESLYRHKTSVGEFSLGTDFPISKDDVSINYNYNNYLIPLIEMVLRKE